MRQRGRVAVHGAPARPVTKSARAVAHRPAATLRQRLHRASHGPRAAGAAPELPLGSHRHSTRRAAEQRGSFEPGPTPIDHTKSQHHDPQLDAGPPRRAPLGVSQPLPSSPDSRGHATRAGRQNRRHDQHHGRHQPPHERLTADRVTDVGECNPPAARPITSPPDRSTHGRGTGPRQPQSHPSRRGHPTPNDSDDATARRDAVSPQRAENPRTLAFRHLGHCSVPVQKFALARATSRRACCRTDSLPARSHPCSERAGINCAAARPGHRPASRRPDNPTGTADTPRQAHAEMPSPAKPTDSLPQPTDQS